MRNCPKCGSYLPDGKLFCVSCGRPAIDVSDSHVDRTRAEKKQTHVRIEQFKELADRTNRAFRKDQHPYAGGTYEQHKSHDPMSEDYYRPKHETVSDSGNMQSRVICALAYFGVFFFLPLAMLPNSEEAKFHANQGLVLFILNLVIGVLGGIMASAFGSVFEIIAIIPPILMINGAYNAFKGEQKPLPLIGNVQILKDNVWR